MDSKNGSVRKKRKLRYFFLDGELYKIIRVDRPHDLVYAWDYAGKRRVMFVWSDAQRRLENAFRMQEVANLIGRHRSRVRDYMYSFAIRQPKRTYSLSTGKPGTHYFSETDVLEVYDHFASLHIGRPRNDGLIISQRLPTKKELKAMMKYNTTMFVQDDKGDFIPAWQEKIW